MRRIRELASALRCYLRRGPGRCVGRFWNPLAAIIPRSIAPELDERLYNLEFMPKTMNRQKSNGVGQRQKALAREWPGKGLLSRKAADRVLAN